MSGVLTTVVTIVLFVSERESEKTEISEMTSAAEEPENGKELFSVQLRKATKNIHDLSDALVNAKLGVTISDDSVWAEGLLVFYEVFKFLEKSLNSHSDSLIGDLLIPDMARTEAFEEDLDFFFGDWREGYQIRPEVRLYLDHLESLDQENPYLLIPYIYHLYMGLFSGGQILAAKVNELIELGQVQFLFFCRENILPCLETRMMILQLVVLLLHIRTRQSNN